MRVLGLCFALSSAVVCAQNLTVTAPLEVSTPTSYDSITVESDGGVLKANAKITVSGDVVIKAGGVITRDQLAPYGPLELAIGGNLRIEIGGKIDVTAKGLPGGKTINPTTGLVTDHNCVNSCPGSHFVKGFSTSPIPSFDEPLNPQFPGGGGRLGSGSGGGAVLIEANTAIIEGAISADGEDRSLLGSSAGAGGTINLRANSIMGSGRLSAHGGDASNICCVGQSAGGLILLRAPTTSFDGTIDVSAGQGVDGLGKQWVNVGTALLHAPTTRDLTVLAGYYPLRYGESYHSVSTRNGATLALVARARVEQPVVASAGAQVIVSDDHALDQIPLSSGVPANGTLQFNVDAGFAADFVLEGTLIINQSLSAPNFEARPGSLVTHDPGVTSMNLVVAKSLTLAKWASIDVSAKGLNGNETIDPASLLVETRTSNLCSGGSHAGQGGSYGDPDVAPASYDDPDQPRFGGGGGPSCGSGCLSRGGGVARITAGNLQLDGLIAADGETCAAGAAGGSVVITARQLAGTGVIRARGGSPTFLSHGAGGGGIILLSTGESTFSGQKDVSGGTSLKPGAAGELREKTSTVAAVLTSSPSTFVKVGTTYVYTPSAVGTPPLTWSLLSRPAGATFEASTGAVSWTPASEEVGHFALEVTNLYGKDSQLFFVRAMSPPSIVGMPSVTASLGTVYQYTPQLTGTTGPVTWSILYGPDGLTINPSSGQVSWSPSIPGTYPVCLEVMNDVGQARQCFAIVVLLSDGGVPAIDGPRFESSPSSRATCGQPYHYLPDTPPQVSGTGPFTYSLEAPAGATIPEGLSVDADTGQLEWTPTREQVGTYVVKLTAAGPGGSSSQVFSIEVGCPQSHTFATCGCSSGTSSLLGLLALTLWRRRQPRASTSRAT